MVTTAGDLRIGDAAALVGVEAHVFRHWESVGLLHPPRTASGHRVYDRQTVDQARMIRILQHAGLSLDQIRQLAVGARDDRENLIQDKREDVRARISLLRATDRFLAHLAECRHPIIADCPDCSDFAAHDRSWSPKQVR